MPNIQENTDPGPDDPISPASGEVLQRKYSFSEIGASHDKMVVWIDGGRA